MNMVNVFELIKTRRSVRTYDGAPLKPEHRDALAASMAELPTPWGITPEFRLLEAKAHGLKSPVITGESLYFAAKLPGNRMPRKPWASPLKSWCWRPGPWAWAPYGWEAP